MTYCVAIKLAQGLVLASDTRTNAGVDHIATFCKMTIFERPGAVLVLLSAGNLATTQSVISLLRQNQAHDDGSSVLTQTSMYDVAVLIGATLRNVIDRDAHNGQQAAGVDFGCSFLLAGQIQGEPPRLFHIYPQGNFIESTEDTPYFQIGESKYGKPILDRVIQYNTPLCEASKCVLISFDSTIRSNLSVGMPIDYLLYRNNSFSTQERQRISEDDPYYQMIRQSWSQGLRDTFAAIENPPWARE
jgi:putative proteasome-type protease